MKSARTKSGMSTSALVSTLGQPISLADGRLIALTLAERAQNAARLAFARAFVGEMVWVYWNTIQTAYGRPWTIFWRSKEPSETLEASARSLARSMGEFAARLSPLEASYQIGTIYTAMLPDEVRSRGGIYYTPPALAERLVELATVAGVDWKRCRVLDPACGGGAFLTPIARRIVDELAGSDPAIIVQNVAARIRGYEIDPFGAWMSQVFVEAALMDISRAAGRRLPPLVDICDSLERDGERARFDLIIGNPPYSKVRLSEERRSRYKRGLYGHANMYGLFTDLALRLTRPGGVVAYVTPTSFLAGQYFQSLRALLACEAPPSGVDFVEARRGVFDDVLQETLLATYRRGAETAEANVHFVTVFPDRNIKVAFVGRFTLPGQASAPWVLPRTVEHVTLVERMRRMPHRLRDYGYKVSTGPLVWNRHKTQLRDGPGKGRYPLIWAEAVRPDGRFEFRATKRNHAPYFEPRLHEEWVVVRNACILLQRTTAKEQQRRLIAAELPTEFLANHQAVVIENHLNMLVPTGASVVAPRILTALLNSSIVDQAFRCINGSVAVSAFELDSLPLPDPCALRAIATFFYRGASRESIDRAASALYLGEA